MRRSFLVALGGLLLLAAPKSGGCVPDLLLYVTKASGVSNLNICDLTTGETKLLTHFTEAGEIGSISTADAGDKIYFTRASPANGRPNATVWQVYIDGSGLTDLTAVAPDTGLDYRHAGISPNGTRIAYTVNDAVLPDEYQLYVCNLNGTNRRKLVTFIPNQACSYPIWLDNDRILFKTRQLVFQQLEDYYIINADGSGLTNLTNNTGLTPYFPRLGRPLLNNLRDKIIFARQTNNTGIYTEWRVYTKSLISGTETLVTSTLYYAEPAPLLQIEPYPSFVADSQMAFAGSQTSTVFDLYVTNLPVVNPYLQRITYGQADVSLPFYFSPQARPSQFAYLFGGNIYFRAAAGSVNQLTADGTNSHPVFNPSGTAIAYTNRGIWTMKTDGSDVTQVEVDTGADYPAFSPDGYYLAYVKNNDIYARLLVDRTAPAVRLTYTPSVSKSDLAFSPGGTELIFTGLSSGKKQIYRLPVRVTLDPFAISTTGTSQNLTPLTNDNFQPQYSPDGENIAFVSTRNQLPELWMMKKNGTGQRKLSVTVNPPVNPACPHFSPYDSNLLCYLSGAPQKVYRLDLSQATLAGVLVTPEIAAGQFSWGKEPTGWVNANRFIVFDTVDPLLTLTYKLYLAVDVVPAPTNAILSETLPAGWILQNVKINGQVPSPLTSNGATTGTLKWNFGPGGLAPLRNSVVELTVDVPDAEIPGGTRNLAGLVETTAGKTITSGDYFLTIAGPGLADYARCPVDGDKNWEISDNELIQTITWWAENSQIHGWPNIDDWDWWLLKIINFWVAGGYQYDSAASVAADEPRWR